MWDLDFKEHPNRPKHPIDKIIYIHILSSPLYLKINNYSSFRLYCNYFRYINFFTKDNKNFNLRNAYTKQYNLRFKTKVPIRPKLVSQVYTFKLFKVFLKFSLFNGSNYFSKHSALKFNYLSPNIKGSATSLNGLFSKWINLFFLISNIFYYDIRFLTFSNSFFIKEVSTLNWNFFKKSNSKGLWRLTQPFIFFKVSQIVNYGPILFKKLKFKGFNISLIIDPLYHLKTLYYLKNNNMFIISLTSSSSRIKSVDLSIPINTNSVFSQLFFIRLIFSISKNVNFNKYNLYHQTWYKLIHTYFS